MASTTTAQVSRPTQPTTVTAKSKRPHDSTVPIAAGGVLALLAVGGAAVAINRRREEDEDYGEAISGEDANYDTSSAEPVQMIPAEEQPQIIAPPVSAFRWDNSPDRKPRDEAGARDTADDRQPGESWVDRARRGPSPLNPSASLKNRLKRAAFFDKRERDAAAGLAAPIDPAAGLPGRLVESESERSASELA